MKTLLFDGYVPGDQALDSSHWIAVRTHERLGEEAIILGHPNAVRRQLEGMLETEGLRGVVFFGHGDPGVTWTVLLRPNHTEPCTLNNTSEQGAIYGCDGESALDCRNTRLLKDRFCHILACNVGFALGPPAIDAGATCFVAYETSITPEFDAAELPAELARLLADVATSTTRNLHQGLFDKGMLEKTLQTAIEALDAWFEEGSGIAWSSEQESFLVVSGIRAFARQLRRDMVVCTSHDLQQR